MRRAFRFMAWTLFLILGLLIVGTYIPRPFWPATKLGQGPVHRILVLSNPIHTDIALPLDNVVRARFGFVLQDGIPIDAPGARYIVIGWGGRDFYLNTPTWSDLKLVPLLRGLTADRSVMHVDVASDIAPDASYATGFDLDDKHLQALAEFILTSFARSQAGPVPIAGYAYGRYDRFYEANGTFTAVLGCNTWTAAALRAGGLRTGLWNPLPPLLRASLRIHN